MQHPESICKHKGGFVDDSINTLAQHCHQFFEGAHHGPGHSHEPCNEAQGQGRPQGHSDDPCNQDHPCHGHPEHDHPPPRCWLQDHPMLKETADKDCLFKQDNECSCPDNLEQKALTDVPEPVQKESHLMASQLKNEDFMISEYKKADESGNPPCYMPQPNDEFPSEDTAKPMGPIGPWATGKVDWSPLAGITGTRPVVDHYSITRYSGNEWRQRNKEVLNKASDVFIKANKNANDCRNTMIRTYSLMDKTQAESTNRLRKRAQLVNKWKCALERSIRAMIEEISTLEEERLRLKQSLLVLKLPEAIVSECLDRRCSRPEPELVRDKTEEELINEMALIAEIRLVFNKTLSDIEQQQVENRTARNRLEYDWSDKREAYDIDTLNIGLNNLSTIIMFKPGATRFPPEQSSDEYWEHFTKESLEECERCRQKSATLRSTLDAILLNAARDLRTQADVVEKALRDRIGCIQELLTRLENELHDCLQKLADTENRIEKMTRGMKGLDNVMKVVQTRLDNRNYRPHVENSRDFAQRALVDEVGTVQGGVSAMLADLTEAENCKRDLMITRGNLEREIMLKRRSIMLDRDRSMLLRSRFPSANALSGYAKI